MQSSNRTATELDSLNFCNSPVCKLPPDILGEIFEFSCTDSPNRRLSNRPASPLELSSVCSYWRTVARTTPQIWTSLSVTEDFWALKHKTDILNHFISNSGGLGLDVKISGRPDDESKIGEHRVLGGDVFDILFTHHPAKLEVVEFEFLFPEWIPIISTISEAGHLTRLKSLKIWGCVRPWDRMHPFSISKVPRLRKYAFTGNHIFVCPWSQITHLSLWGVDYRITFHIIKQCINLEFLYCWDTPRPCRPNTHRTQTTLPRLQELVCRNDKKGTPWYTDFQYLQLPSLKTLSLDPVPIRDCIGGGPWPLRFPRALTSLSLTLKYGRGESYFLRDGFSSLVNLQELDLHCWGQVSLKVIELLIFPSSSMANLGTDFNPNSTRFLPQLIDLSITGRYDKDSNLFPLMLEVVRSRWRASECQTLRKCVFSHRGGDVETDYPAISALVSSFGSGLRPMVREGLEVTMRWNYEDVTRNLFGLNG